MIQSPSYESIRSQPSLSFVIHHPSSNQLGNPIYTSTPQGRRNSAVNRSGEHTSQPPHHHTTSTMSTHLSVLVDEAQQRRNARIHTRPVGLSASKSEAHKAKQLLRGVDNGATRVTLARVLAASGETSTEHVVGDGRGAVGSAARSAGDDGDADFLQRRGARAVLAESTPAGDGEAGARCGVRVCGGQAGVGNVAAGCDGGAELPDGHVVVFARGAVVGVRDYLGDADEGAT